MLDKEQMKELSCIEIYAEVDRHMTAALMFHSEMSDYFNFLGLHGFKRAHELQYFEESIWKRKLHKKVLDLHNKLIPIRGHEKPEVIPVEWYGYTRLDVDDNILAKFVRQAVKQYKEWEEKTKTFYESVCCVFLEKGWLADYNLMMCYLDNVQHELKKIYRLCEELNGTGYDVLYIVEIQKRIHDDCKTQMKKLKIQE